MKSVDRRGETFATPQELISAAGDALKKWSSHPIQLPFIDDKLRIQAHRAMEAAYSAVVSDRLLGPKFEELLKETVSRLPAVESTRISIEEAMYRYRVPHLNIIYKVFNAEYPIEMMQDTLFLLQKVISPK